MRPLKLGRCFITRFLFPGMITFLMIKGDPVFAMIDKKSGGQTELLGGLCYTTTAGKLAPIFVCTGSSVSIRISESCFNGDPYSTIIKDIRAGEAKTLINSDLRYRGKIILYSGYSSKP